MKGLFTKSIAMASALSITALFASAEDVCETQIIGYTPVYSGYASCQASAYFGNTLVQDTLYEYISSSYQNSVQLSEYRYQPDPGGYLSCTAWIPWSHDEPILLQSCAVVGSFQEDGNDLPLYNSNQTAVENSQNLDTDSQEIMTWDNPGSFYTRFEYRVDYGTSGNSSGSTDIGWTHYITYGIGVENGILNYKPGTVTTSNVPTHYYNSPSQWYNPNDYAKVYYRMRLEDSNGGTGPWRFLRAIWVYNND